MRSFFFYDLETSGLSGSMDRIMQFAGQRTDSNLNPIGDPVNILVRLSDDILPSPQAIMTTGITPQQTIAEGISEPEFCRFFLEEIATSDSIILGYNSTRFDDEFIRHTLWRNFYDPYEWSWSNNRSRWDLLDVCRFVRALRPDGINWPVRQTLDSDGNKILSPTVNLVDMAMQNGFENKNAHDALADVIALINLAKLLREKQPKMWEFLLNNHDKKSVEAIIKPKSPVPFIYTSGKFDSKHEKTTVAIVVGPGRSSNKYVVWDLRHSIEDFANMTPDDIKANLSADWETRKSPDFRRLPIKEISVNKCPAVAPLGVLDKDSQKRIDLNLITIKENLKKVKSNVAFLVQLLTIHNEQESRVVTDVEGALYDSLLPDHDKNLIRLVTAADANQLADLHPEFADERYPELLLRYKARNYPNSLSEEETARWEAYRLQKLEKNLPSFINELNNLYQSGADDFLINELKLWAESIVPSDY